MLELEHFLSLFLDRDVAVIREHIEELFSDESLRAHIRDTTSKVLASRPILRRDTDGESAGMSLPGS